MLGSDLVLTDSCSCS